jgi:hypothetical protein
VINQKAVSTIDHRPSTNSATLFSSTPRESITMVCSLLRTRVTLQASDRAGDLSMDFKFNPKSTEVKEVIQQARSCFKKKQHQSRCTQRIVHGRARDQLLPGICSRFFPL